MKFEQIEPNVELLVATAPKRINELVSDEKKETMIFAGLDNGEVICYAVFSHFPEAGHDVYLDYFYTLPEHRRQGCIKRLVEESAKVLKKSGVSSILIRHKAVYEKAEELNEIVLKAGCLPLNLTGRVLLYRLHDMLDAGVFQTIIKNRKKLPQVYDINSIGQERMPMMMAKASAQGFSFVQDKNMEPYSRFYVEDGEIDAALIAVKPGEDTLYITGVYLEDKKKDQNLFLILFSECVYAALQSDEDKEFKIILSVDNDGIYKGLMNIFNPPDMEQLVLEYMLPLSKKGGKD